MRQNLRKNIKIDGEKVTPAMKVKNVHFFYGKNKILNGVSFQIEEGKVTTIMGANGCGKSTLFSLMTKNLYPAKGNIFLKGKNILNLNLKEFARKVAIVQQYNTASDDITVESLISFGRTPYKKMMQANSREDEEKIQWAMEVTGLTEYRNREVSRLSGGQRQRVWIAMALAQGTKTLFLDEPTTYLDIRYQIEILKLVKKLNQEYGITIVMVLHDINQAITYSDRIIGLKDGQVLVEGAPEEVITEESIRELYGINLGVTSIDGRKFVLAV
ncbi:ABC transporter ATP-binding protein [Dorea sp.]